MAETDKKIAAVPGPRILFARHGQTRMNHPKGSSLDVVRGQSNPPLDSDGKKEAKDLGADLAGASIIELYASPLGRTMHTAMEIGKPYGLKPRATKELLPWDMGDLQGVQADIARPVLRQFAEDHPKQPIRHGESFNRWRQRLLDWMRKLMQHVEDREITVCCVTHSRCLKLLEGWLKTGDKGLAVDFNTMFNENTEPGEVFEMRPVGGKWQMKPLGRGFKPKE